MPSKPRITSFCLNFSGGADVPHAAAKSAATMVRAKVVLFSIR